MASERINVQYKFERNLTNPETSAQRNLVLECNVALTKTNDLVRLDRFEVKLQFVFLSIFVEFVGVW